MLNINLLLPFRKRNLSGYCTPDKTIVIPCEYDNACPFTGDTAIVRRDGKYGAINRSGKLFIPFSYTSINKARCEIYMYDEVWCDEGELIDPDYDEECSHPPPPEEGTVFTCGGVAFRYANEQYKAVDETLSGEAYEAVGLFKEGLIWVQKNKKWGAITSLGKQTIPCMYDDIEPFDEDLPEYAYVYINNKWGIINHDHIQYWED